MLAHGSSFAHHRSRLSPSRDVSGAIVDRRCLPNRAIMPSIAICSPSAVAPTASPAGPIASCPTTFISSSPPPTRTPFRGRWGRRIGASPRSSTRAPARPAICSRGGSPSSRWTTPTSSTRCALSRSIRFAPGWPRLLKRGRGRACARIFKGRDDALVEVGPALERAPRFADLLELSLDEQAALDGFETLSPNGRPLGGQDFIAMVETKLGRKVRPAKRGRKPHGGRMD